MDLKQRNRYWILHIIDMWSRYTASVFIISEKPSDVIDALMQRWIAVFGTIGSIMTDNGREFSSDEMRKVAPILNVKLITTAADSPFQNGLCERVQSVTDMMLLKLMEENKETESQTLLSWANMARNSLQMWNGFSSHQLVFGKNPNLPGIMSDKLPALEPGRVAQSVGHLTRKSGVLGSIPGLATYFRFSFRFSKKGSCQLLAKVCARSTG